MADEQSQSGADVVSETEPTVRHRPAKGASVGRFDLERGGKAIGYLSYSMNDKTMSIHYVEVDPALRGKKMGEQLVAAAVDWARTNRYDVVPICGYAREVMSRMNR